LKLRIIIFNILVGIPGGCLIFMGMLMFNTLLSLLVPPSHWMMLIILCITSLAVGMLARLMRPFHGLGTAIASGVIAALLILYLWRVSVAGTNNSLVFSPAGMLVTIGFSILGALIYPLLRRRTTTRAVKIKETGK
jgi:hypothetical protein